MTNKDWKKYKNDIIRNEPRIFNFYNLKMILKEFDKRINQVQAFEVLKVEAPKTTSTKQLTLF